MVLSNLRLHFCYKQTEIYISSAFTQEKHDMKYINSSPRDSREIYNKDLKCSDLVAGITASSEPCLTS